MVHAVVMAGGSGTRFWPASRAIRPKQLLALSGEQSMIQATVSRLDGCVPSENIWVITNQKLVVPIQTQLPQLSPHAIIGEPCKRDTAPCVGLAAVLISKNDPDATMLVMPSDHVIKDVRAFQGSIRAAEQLLLENPKRLITFGIKPTYPAESFGYIEKGDSISGSNGAFRVMKFREKPKLQIAQEYVASENYYWNAGIFIWKAQTILEQLSEREPQMFAHLETIGQAIGKPDFPKIFETEFSAIIGKSIDYAVMEHAPEVVTLEAPFDWDDVGSWQALARLRGTDSHGNTIAAKHVGIDTQNTIVRSENGHLVVTLGIKDCLVVHTPDATLVADKNREEEVREIVKLLDEQDLHEFL